MRPSTSPKALHVGRHHRESFGGVQSVLEAMHVTRSEPVLSGSDFVRCDGTSLSQNLRTGPGTTAEDSQAFVRAAEAAIALEDPDVVHLHQLHFPYEPGLLEELVGLASVQGLGCLLTAYDADDEHFTVQDIGAAIARGRCRHRGLRVLAPTHYIAGRLSSVGVDATVLPACTSIGLPWHTSTKPNVVRIGLPGRIVTRKGHETLVRAMADLDGLELILSSHGNADLRLLHEIQLLAQRSRVPLSFAKSSKHLYEACRVIVACPRLNEGQGLTPVEALAYGRPTVVLARGGLREYMGIPGLLLLTPSRDGTRESDVAILKEGLHEVLTNLARYEEDASIGRDLARRCFSPESIAARLDLVYRDQSAVRA